MSLIKSSWNGGVMLIYLGEADSQLTDFQQLALIQSAKWGNYSPLDACPFDLCVHFGSGKEEKENHMVIFSGYEISHTRVFGGFFWQNMAQHLLPPIYCLKLDLQTTSWRQRSKNRTFRSPESRAPIRTAITVTLQHWFGIAQTDEWYEQIKRSMIALKRAQLR